MQSCLNDPKLKERFIEEIIKNEKGDAIVKQNEAELCIPQVLARLEDTIFKGLPNEESKTWPRRFAEAVPVGADLAMVWPSLPYGC